MKVVLDYVSLFFTILGNFFMFSSMVGLMRYKDFYIKLHAMTMFSLYGISFTIFAVGVKSSDPVIFFETLLIIIVNVLTTLGVVHCLVRNAMLSNIEYKAQTREEVLNAKTENIKKRMFKEEEEKLRKKREEELKKIRQEEISRKGGVNGQKLQGNSVAATDKTIFPGSIRPIFDNRKIYDNDEEVAFSSSIKSPRGNAETFPYNYTKMPPYSGMESPYGKGGTMETFPYGGVGTAGVPPYGGVGVLPNSGAGATPSSSAPKPSLSKSRAIPSRSSNSAVRSSAAKGTLSSQKGVAGDNEDMKAKIREQKKILKKKIETARKNAFITRKPAEIEKTEKMINDILVKYHLTEKMLEEDS
ncbi:MAG: monovalent cation/H(+) antiporter subunit G [Rickettsiales bacterium]|jgi:multicomponent Na+:H+ antiporter subunit G|nr:monovalent cation/H(+) antiporter subunit G [Rickettsiales bacterium]